MRVENSGRRVCRLCVLPEAPPDITLDDTGLCSVCAASAGRPLSEDRELPETELIKLLDRHRGKGRYDCLLMCSGGKDSTMALYRVVRRYRLRPLAFTFDHGFENGAALDNVRNAVRALGVDWLYFASSEAKDIFRLLLKSGSKAPVCHVCAIWYIRETFRQAAALGIPLVIGGWTRGQSSARGEGCPEFASMSRATEAFVNGELRRLPRWKDFPRSVKEAAESAPRGITAVSPHWFLRHDPEESAAILEKELGWRRTPQSYPKNSTNCLLNFLSVELSLKNFGYTHYHSELSRLIRLGEIGRDEALELLEPDFDPELAAKIRRELEAGDGHGPAE